MSAYNKIVWSEGLFLRPQHFQQQNRYIERLLETRTVALRSHSWGCIELELERDLLAIGKLGLRRAVGVMPDGTPFRMPDDEPLPVPLQIEAAVRDEAVYLSLPVRTDSGAEIERDVSDAPHVRNGLREFEARDTTSSGATTATLEVAPLRVRLMLEHQPAEGYARIPVARVLERRADQKVMLDEGFLPTVLDVRAAPPLATFLTELQGLLHTRGDALAGRVSASGRGGAAEIADFLMLQTINRFEPLATHFMTGSLLHPEDLYRFCVTLAGDLSTFATQTKRPKAYPVYSHERLRESFEPVMAALRALLSLEIVQSVIPIAIEPRKFGLSVAMVADKTLFKSAAFILAARADMPAEELRRVFPAHLKIAPVEKITNFVRNAVPGLAVQPMPVAPRQIPYHAGYVYFELDQSGSLWGELTVSGGLGIHVAGEFSGLKMELWAVRG